MTDLPKVKAKSKKRIGRGYGSGKGGHTVGRGQKGQKARSHINVLFEGIKVKKSLLKKLPLNRGKGKLRPTGKPIIIKLSYLNLLAAGSTVDTALLIKEGIVEKDAAFVSGVKILGGGKLTKKLNVAVPISKSAAKDVIKAGGTVKEK